MLFLQFLPGSMRAISCVLFAFLALAVTTAFPQKEGNSYTNEAIRQAQQSYLIPKDAQIQKVRNYFESNSLLLLIQ